MHLLRRRPYSFPSTGTRDVITMLSHSFDKSSSSDSNWTVDAHLGEEFYNRRGFMQNSSGIHSGDLKPVTFFVYLINMTKTLQVINETLILEMNMRKDTVLLKIGNNHSYVAKKINLF